MLSTSKVDIFEVVKSEALEIDNLFLGKWLNTFSKEKTKGKNFHLLNGETKEVPMMTQTGKFKLKIENDFQILELPYEEESMKMFVMLPKDKDGFYKLEDSLRKMSDEEVAETFNFDKQNKMKVTVSMPKFKIESNIELKEILMDLGFGHIFDRTANFQEMISNEIKPGTGQVFVSKALQKAFIQV